MKLKFHTLDVFTSERFGGNPLAVVMGADGLSSAQMQKIAREFNLSETVFVLEAENSEHTARIRIFTPVLEMPFAGHPTIGTAILLSQLGGDENIVLEEGVGPIDVSVKSDGHGRPFAEFAAAKSPVSSGKAPDDLAISRALGLGVDDIGFDDHRPCLFDAGVQFLFVPVASRDALAASVVNMAAWPGLEGADGIGVYVYCRGIVDGVDYHSRMFGPSVGVMEDPATGSAAAAFPGAIHVGSVFADGRHDLVVAQGEDMGRPSLVYLSIDISSADISAVRVGGGAVNVLEGEVSC